MISWILLLSSINLNTELISLRIWPWPFFIFHHKYTYIHPFIDGNGRSARLLTNLILMKNGYPICVIKMEDRGEYMNALEKASVEDNYDDFIKIIEKAVDASLDNYLYIVG